MSMNTVPLFHDDQLAALAPTQLPSFRRSRYLGDDLNVPLSAFSASDRAILEGLYAQLRRLFALLRANLETSQAALAAVQELRGEAAWQEAMSRVHQLGTYLDAPPSDRMRQVLHDIRGGALPALFIQLQFIDLGIAQPNDVVRLFYLSRDHLKMMRNAVPEIDPEGIARDSTELLHGVDLLVEKWQGANHAFDEASATIVVDCRFRGSVSERCVEFAALDRVLYNLLNNAVRFTADGLVSLTMLPTPASQPSDVRFVVANRVSEAQRTRLWARYGGRLGGLFEGGFTTGGSGAGMRICGEFVANAYGLSPYGRVIDEGYVGAALHDDVFVAWFHWPIVAD